MKAPEHIVVFHPAAIGDSMLATPVAAVLKRNFQSARITYWTHGSLKAVIKDMCPFVDDFIDYVRGKNIFSLSSQFRSMNPDLFVDLSNSSKGRLMPLFTGIRTAHYKKLSDPLSRHAADNFVDTIRDLVEDVPEKLFPTVFPEDSFVETVAGQFSVERSKPIIGIVPGVGNVRPNRAWTQEGFGQLLDLLVERNEESPILFGGPDEAELGKELADKHGGAKVLNLCGKLDLAQTAALLKICRLVVSGDTGPAHISVAVGTPVVGLYGPTALERSGPYGNLKYAIDKRQDCRCQYEKQCRYNEGGTAGECMTRITVGDVTDKIAQVIQAL